LHYWDHLQKPIQWKHNRRCNSEIKEGNNCVVEGTDRIPRVIKECSYNVNDTILITYKEQQPAIEKHEIKQ
jgi:CMP-2-keto-3-deoxyoctulosonic acid synthetase